ncbi:ABC transporter substrate-binding protein [uncultured Bifidobacterium sp.]|uniref:ABC transporter substrate-binding protein n=1 Tax=uncultured Bifidobacterium sp. TaxID=165187 RepID=UPI0028DB8479|nr:ABC transporter substrate-binding protein [uncultured Bifidobacterium sp.]
MGARHTNHGSLRRWGIFLALATALLALVWAGWTFVSSRGGLVTTTSLDRSPRISIGLLNAPDSLDIRTNDSDAVERALLGNVYETLTTRTQKNTITSGLARRWTTSSDALTYVLTLRDGLRFSNGDALDSDDVVWSLQRIITRKYVDSDGLDALKSVTASNARTVTLTLSKPDPTLLRTLSGRAGIVYDRNADIDYATTALGSGPFTVGRFTARSSLTLLRNADYWGSRADASQITLRYYSDDAGLAAALTSDDIDMALPSSALESDRYASLSGTRTVYGETTSKTLLAFNTGADSLFSDERVRTSTRYFIDTAAIAKQQKDAYAPLGGPISPLEPGYADLTGLYPYDVAKGQSLIGFFALHYLGTATILTPSRYSSLADTLVTELSKNNRYEVTKQVVDDATLARRMTSGDYTMAIITMDDTGDASRFASGDSVFRYENSDAQSAYDQAMSSTTDAAYRSHLKDFASIVSKDAASAWLYTRRNIVVVRDGTTGYPTNMTDQMLPLARLSD